MLDPRRIGLNAADIGFQKRMRQDLDFGAIETALQTDYNNQGSAVQVRREREAAKDEIHIMGGELAGFQSNDLIKTLARQERQINGYPLRHFDAQNPAVILPKKYGGFPLYNRNQTEYDNYVSVFTEPMSAPLQRDTELLSRMGKVPVSNSLTNPFEEEGYMNPMNKTYDQLQANKGEFIQRRHLQNMSDRSKMLKFNVPNGESGIYINPSGDPVSTVQEQLTGQIVANNTFADAQRHHLTRIAAYQNGGEIGFNLPIFAGAGSLVQEGDEDTPIVRTRRQGQGLPAASPETFVNRENEGAIQFDFDSTAAYLADNAYDMKPTIRQRVATSNPNLVNNPVPALKGGMQPKELFPFGDINETDVFLPFFGGHELAVNRSGYPKGVRIDISSDPNFKEGTPTVVFKNHRRYSMLSETKGSNRANEVLGYAVRQRRNKKNTFKTPSKAATTTPFKQQIHTIDYGALNKSVASPGNNSRYAI